MRLEFSHGPAPAPDAIIVSDTDTLKGLAFGGLPVAAAQEMGALTLSGDSAKAERFFGLFRLPEPVAAA